MRQVHAVPAGDCAPGAGLCGHGAGRSRRTRAGSRSAPADRGVAADEPVRAWHWAGRVRGVRAEALWGGVGRMLEVTIDGRREPFEPGETILDVAKRLKIEIPTLCHDDRIKT